MLFYKLLSEIIVEFGHEW